MNIALTLKNIPESPGIYKYYNADQDIIYIGKAKNLKKRVSSYFKKNAILNFAKQKMIQEIQNIEYILTENEIESLLLENNLIKRHQPKYNVLLKDDKNFLYIKVTSEEFPKVIKTRIPPNSEGKLGGKYFGPYISGFQVQEILKILKKIFGYGIGNKHFFRNSQSYTLDPYIFEGNIQGDEKILKELYLKKIQEIQVFLSGNTGEIEEKLKTDMQYFAKNLEFEEAQKKKNTLDSLQVLKSTQRVQSEVRGNAVVLQILEKYGKYYGGLIEIEDSILVSYKNFELENTENTNREEALVTLAEYAFSEIYREKGDKAQKYIFLLPFSISPGIFPFQYEIPELGAKADVLKICYKNLYDYAYKQHMQQLSSKSFSKHTMKNLLELLGYVQKNEHIIFECNDISHLSGTHTVASRSVIEDGKKNPKKYKKYRIKTLEQGKINDFGSLKEVIERRIREMEKLGNIPDLIIIDGGKGQLSSVLESIQSSPQSYLLNEKKLQLISLAKKEEEIFLPYQSDPIILSHESNELRLIQTIRDEAHRFAITFNRDSRNKSIKKSLLESLPGIGPQTRKKILKLYGSIDALKNFSPEELCSTLGKKVYETLENHGII